MKKHNLRNVTVASSASVRIRLILLSLKANNGSPGKYSDKFNSIRSVFSCGMKLRYIIGLDKKRENSELHWRGNLFAVDRSRASRRVSNFARYGKMKIARREELLSCEA